MPAAGERLYSHLSQAEAKLRAIMNGIGPTFGEIRLSEPEEERWFPYRPDSLAAWNGRGRNEGFTRLDGMWTESKKIGGKIWKAWKAVGRSSATSLCCTSFSGYPSFTLPKCNLARLSFVAGAELRKRYVVTS